MHEARKAIKRMRALARLFREEMGEPEFGRVNSSLGEAGRRLSSARDAQVRLATLKSLAERRPGALASSGIDLFGIHLEHERALAGEPADSAEVLEDIAAMRRQLARWELTARDFEDLAPGLQRIYEEGRKRYRRAKRERPYGAAKAKHPSREAAAGREREPVPSDQAMHDWRKRVKSLYYALDMLGGKRTKGARKATRRAERLGDLLGEEHDLWMLSLYAEQHSDVFGQDSRACEDLLATIACERRRLRKRALGLGARLYKRSPGRFTQRMRAAFSR